MDILVAIDQLDDAAHHARPVPLTDRVRLDPERLAADVAHLRSTWPAGAPDTLLYELDAIVADAKRLP
jgi:hypothetical protein